MLLVRPVICHTTTDEDNRVGTEPQYRSFLGMLRIHTPHPPGKPSQGALFAQTAKAVFSQELPKAWLLSGASQSLVFQVPPGFINDDFLASLVSHISGLGCGDFQRYAVISANLAGLRATHRVNAPSALLCTLIHQVIWQHPLLWRKIRSLFSSDALVSVFRGKSACLLESLLWRSFAALLSANQPIACVLLVDEDGIHAATLGSFFERMISLTGLIDCGCKLMVVGKIGAGAAFKGPAVTWTLNISNVLIKTSMDDDFSHFLGLVLGSRSEAYKTMVGSFSTSHPDPLMLMTLIRHLGTRGFTSRLQITQALKLLSAQDVLFSSILHTVPDSEKTVIRDILLVLTHIFRPLSTTELGVAVAIMARDGPATPVQDLVPVSIQHGVSTYLSGLVSVNHESICLAHPGLKSFLDAKQSTAQHWYQPGTHPHLAMVKLCIQCIALYSERPSRNAPHEDGSSTVAEQGTEESESHSPSRDSINPLLEYAVLNWPFHALAALSDGVEEAVVVSIINLLSDDGAIEWLRLWTELSCPMYPPPYPSQRLSPLKLATQIRQPLKSALTVCLHALDSFVALDRNEDVALVWGLAKAVGAEAAVKFWHDQTQQAPRDTRLFLSLFGLDPGLAFELVKSVDKAFVDGHLPQLLTLGLSFGNDAVLQYMIQQDLAVGPILRIIDGELCSEEASSPSGEDFQDLAAPPPDNQELHLSTLGWTEICGRATDGLQGLLHALNAEFLSAAMDAAVANGNLDATNTLLCLRPDSDSRFVTGTSAIHIASKYGFIKILEQLIPAWKGTDLHFPDGEGSTPLHLAARNGYIHVVETLLAHGASTSAKDGHGETPFSIAVKLGNLELVQLFLKSCQQHERGETDEPSQGNSNNNRTLINELDGERRAPLISALEIGSLQISSLLVKHGAKLDVADHRGRDPLYLAAEHGFSDFLTTVLKDKADDISRECLSAALRISVFEGHAACVSALLESRPGLPTELLLATAIRGKQVEVVKVLLEKAQLNDTELGDNLHNAAMNGHTELLTILLDAGADKDHTDSVNNTALQLAAYFNHATTVEALLLRRADLEIKDLEGRTALCDAARHGSREAIKLLLDAGADVNVRDDAGDTPFELAAGKNNEEAVILILSKMASRGTGDDSVTEGELLRRMINRRSKKVVEYLLRRNTRLVTSETTANPSPSDLQAALETKDVDLVSMLLKYGADPNGVADKFSRSPIQYAASNCDRGIAELLLGEGHPKGKADVNKTGGYVWSALYACVLGEASDEEKQNMFDLLLKHDADPSDASGQYGTVLHVASRWCSEALVRHILETTSGRLSLHTKDREGRLPAHFAASGGNKTLFPLVLKSGLNARDTQLRLPIHMAAARGSPRALSYIVDESGLGALCEKDADGWNVLHWACRQRDRDVIAWIMGQVAESDAVQQELTTSRTTHENWLPSDVAVRHKNERFLEILQPLDQPPHEERPGETAEGWMRTANECDSCYTVSFSPLVCKHHVGVFCRAVLTRSQWIYGERHKCQTCVDFDLCFKCFRHVGDIHDTSHEFTTIEAQLDDD